MGTERRPHERRVAGKVGVQLLRRENRVGGRGLGEATRKVHNRTVEVAVARDNHSGCDPRAHGRQFLIERRVAERDRSARHLGRQAREHDLVSDRLHHSSAVLGDRVVGECFPPADERGQTFGVELDFTPTIIDSTHLNLKVRPEVSQLTSTGACSRPTTGT